MTWDVSAQELVTLDSQNTWGKFTEDGSFHVPVSGYYTLTLSGGQGYGIGAAGGMGTVITCDIWLEKDDVVVYEVGGQGFTDKVDNTLNIHGGNASYVYVNSNQVLQAPGGVGVCVNGSTVTDTNIQRVLLKADNLSNSQSEGTVHWHTIADGSLSEGTIYATTAPGGCYNAAGHTHDKLGTCSKKANYKHACDSGCKEKVKEWVECDGCDTCISAGCSCQPKREKYTDHSDNKVFSHWTYNCGYPTNTWTIQCGNNHGGIYNTSAVTGSIETVADCCVDSKVTKSNTGDGYFYLELKETSNLYNQGKQVKVPYYEDGKCNLIINNDTVVYFKR